MRELTGVLGEIVARKRRDVAERFASGPDPREAAEPTQRSLRSALARPGARFVMEVKRASPSEGAIRAGADPAAVARAYTGAADAISVLTDTPWFGGSLDDLRAVRAVFEGPILAKDFVIDVRQVAEARLAGADAVLVMLSVLEDPEAAEVIAEARRLGMDALVEAHDEGEVQRAVALGAPLIGINNRDLKTLSVDLGVTERLAGLVPEDRVLVAESGIQERGDVLRLSPFVDAFLVGSSLMRAADPGLAARALAFGRVKVCGLTRAEDVALAAAAGASFGGVVMVPGTPRAVDGAGAEALAAAAQAKGLALVGVFRDEDAMEVALKARTLGLAAVQLHGEEDAGYIKRLRALLSERTEIWAVGAVGETVTEPRAGADRTLFDTAVDGRSGGTGTAFDWALLDGRPELGRAVLAGGLRPENAFAASRVGAYALDVGSGLEAAAGRKDPAKLAAFFEALRVPVRGEIG
jgi:indole-3-glycerol phosphate synthase/phosphoribosylanthranilate isomerase